MNYDGFEGSIRSYSRIGGAIAREYGIPIPDRAGRTCLECVMEQIECVIREECRRAAEESALRVKQLAARHLPDSAEEGLFIPKSEIYINAGGVGTLKLHSFRGWREDGMILASGGQAGVETTINPIGVPSRFVKEKGAG